MTQRARSPFGKLLPLRPLALVLVASVGACSPDSSNGPMSAGAPAPRALLGLDPLIETTTTTLTSTTTTLAQTVDATLSGLLGLLSTCEQQDQLSATKYIGPYGGRIVVGNHELTVPPGALSQTVKITATRLSASVAQVDFQPHGLRFAKPAALRLTYDHCTVSPKNVQSVVYVNDGMDILEAPRSIDDQKADQVTAWINHFSGYAVATRLME